MGKVKKYLVGIVVGSAVAGGTAYMITRKKTPENPYDELDFPTQPKKSRFKEAKATFLTIKDQVTTIKNEGLPAVKSTIGDISELVKTFQKEIQPHLTQIKDDLNELEKTKQKLEAETGKPPTPSETSHL